MGPTVGRFAGEVIDDTEASTTGAYAGPELDDPTPVAEPAAEPQNVSPDPAPEPTPEPPTYNPLNVLDTPIQKGPTAVGVEPQTVNLFAGEELADKASGSKPKPAPTAPEVAEILAEPDLPIEPKKMAPKPAAKPAPKPEMKRGIESSTAPGSESNTSSNEGESDPKPVPVNKRAKAAKRSRKMDHSDAVTAAVVAEATENSRPRSFFDDPDADMSGPDTGMIEPVKKKPRKVKADGSPTFGQKVKEGFEKFGKVSLGGFVGLVIGALIAGWILAVFGPWQVTNVGIVPRDTGYPINAIPAGTAITMTQVGTVAPSGSAKFNPIVLGASKAVVQTPIGDGNGRVIGYTVTCVSGSCTEGLSFDISSEAVLGAG